MRTEPSRRPSSRYAAPSSEPVSTNASARSLRTTSCSSRFAIATSERLRRSPGLSGFPPPSTSTGGSNASHRRCETLSAAAASRIQYHEAQSATLFPFVEDVLSDDHPRDEQIAAFLDNGLSAAERDTVTRHLASCDECRALVGPAREISKRTRTARPLWATAAGLAAAAVLIVSVSVRSRSTPGDVDRVRTATTTTVETPQLAAKSPESGASVSLDTLVLRWESAGQGTTYEVSIVDDSGALVWNARVDSVGIAPPREVTDRLRAGSTYYWRADALLSDLRTASTGPQGFIPASQ